MNSTVDLVSPLVSDPEQERLALILSRYVDDMERGTAPAPEELLAANPELEGPLRSYLASLTVLQQAAEGMGVRAAEGLASPDLPMGVLGDYQLVREVGRGGMGIVYEARQISLCRTVALKILPFTALLDPKQVTRFQNEAQAAATLHHPNIVTVFAVGCERGVHYYSMQFIDGQSLCEIIQDLRLTAANHAIPSSKMSRVDSTAAVGRCDHAQSATVRRCGTFSTLQSVRTKNYVRAAVELSAQAAEAIHHAHQCGVVHRDVKPSNLLVDKHGKAWVTDFGLARCEVGPNLTLTGDMLGTLRYMSPEQAAGKPHLVDHRTDIYSLGLTLFELLALRPAFEGDDRRDLLRRISEEEPPSVRSLNSAVPYDLETIILKATAKVREDRYGTAQELADDLRRFLAGEPARARRPALVDRGVKWLLRHRQVAMASLAVMALVLMGVSIFAVALARKQQQTDAALGRARSHLREVHQVVDRFGAGVSEQLRDVPGAEVVRGNLLRETLVYYHALLGYAGDDPLVREDAAKAAFKAGTIHELIGEHERALAMYRDAKERFLQLVADRPGVASHRADAALCDNNLGALWTRLGRTADARDALQNARDCQRELVATNPGVGRYREELALTQINLGLAMAEIGRTENAAASYREAISQFSELVSANPADAEIRQRLANAQHNLSGLLQDSDPAEAVRLAREAVELLRAIPGPSARAELSLALTNLGVLANRGRRPEEAEIAMREAIAILEQLAGDAPRVVRTRVDLAAARNNLGQVLLDSENLPAAQREFEAARQLFEELLKSFPEDPMHSGGLAGVLNNLGIVDERQGNLEKAANEFRLAIEFQRAACQRAPLVKRYHEYLDRHYANLVRVLRSLGHVDEAEQVQPVGSFDRKI